MCSLVLSIVALPVNEFLNLFFQGTKPNTIDLPHRLFQEFLATVYLVFDLEASDALFAENREKCQGSSLVVVLRPMGLDNVIKLTS